MSVLQNIEIKEAIALCRAKIKSVNSNNIVQYLCEENAAFDRVLNVLDQAFTVADEIGEQDKKGIGIKTATVFIMSVYAKIRNGQMVKEFTDADWKDIANIAAKYAVLVDPREYSILVFETYRASINFAIGYMENSCESTIDRLKGIAEEMSLYAEQVRDESMTEAKYIEECLWLSLEAVILVLSDRIGLNKSHHEFVVAVSSLLFQQLRFQIYSEELDVVEECLQEQQELDAALEHRVNEYIDRLNSELDYFDELVEEAFSSDINTAFKGSMKLSEHTGAEDILKSTQAIDEYFMS